MYSHVWLRVGGKRDINEGRHGDWLYLAYELY